MLRSGRLAVLVLALTLGCGDLSQVTPPPVPLSALTASFAGVAGVPDTTPATSVRLARAVAPDSLVVLHLPDIQGSMRRLKKTSLYEFLQSPALKMSFEPLTAQLSMVQSSAAGFDADRLLRSMKGEFVIALEDLEADETGKVVSAKVLGAVTVRGAARQAEKALEMFTLLAASSKTAKVEKGSVEGAPFTRVRPSDPAEPVIEFALYREAIFFGIGAETVTGALGRLRAGRGQSIVNAAAYQRAMERCGDPNDALRIHVNLSGVFGRVASRLPDDVLKALQAAGLSDWNALTIAARPEGKDIALSTFIDSPGGNDFISNAIGRHPADRQFLSRVPKDASSFSLFALDGAEILKRLREALPADALKELDEGLAAIKARGVDIEKDVLEVFGPRGCLVTLPRGRSGAQGLDAIWDLVLGTAVMVDVKDPSAAERVLRKLPNEGENIRRRTREVHGVEVVSYRVDVADIPDDVAPCYAYVDDFLIVALSEETMERMLKPRAPETAQKFREILKDVPDMASIITYDDTRRGLRMMFDTISTSIRQKLGANNVDAPRINFEDLTRDWNKTLSYTIADERGIYVHTVSPTAGVGSFGGIGGLFVLSSIAIPNFAQARERNNEAAAISTMRRIHGAQQAFRANGVRDADGDGEGEFGFLVELLGKERPGDKTVRQRTQLLTGVARANGEFASKGYRFRIFLPSEDGSPVGGHEAAARLAEVDGDLAETIAIIVAWPDGNGSGRRAFIMEADGTIYACADGGYAGKNAPAPDVLRAQAGNLASKRVVGNAARDGKTWDKVRH
ncbi:MAG: hypothetical protein ACYTGN_00885 [Planctomycetota bacterium]|jgi:hypothetical protein